MKNQGRLFGEIRYGQKGFTLIELLVVVAILGTLGAMALPNVTRFIGKGQEEASATELQIVQTTVTAMMTDQGITAIENPASTGTKDMTAFPSTTSAEQVLYGSSFGGGTNYLRNSTTRNAYTVTADGAVSKS